MNIIKYHLLIVCISIHLMSITFYKDLRFFKKFKIYKSFPSSFFPSLHDGLACLLSTPCFEALKFLPPFCAIIVFANLFYKNILSFFLCYLASSELIDYQVETFFPKIAHVKNSRAIYIHSKTFYQKVSNRKKDTIKIILINSKTNNLCFGCFVSISISVSALTGKSNPQFFKFYKINISLEPNIPGSENTTMI